MSRRHLEAPLTDAENCCVPPGPSVAFDGDAETATVGEELEELEAAVKTTSTQ